MWDVYIDTHPPTGAQILPPELSNLDASQGHDLIRHQMVEARRIIAPDSQVDNDPTLIKHSELSLQLLLPIFQSNIIRTFVRHDHNQDIKLMPPFIVVNDSD